MPYGTDILGDEIGGRDLLTRGALRLRRLILPPGGLLIAGVPQFDQNMDLHLQDNDKIFFGTGDDSTISYDGTNLIIDPDVVGSGDLRINGDMVFATPTDQIGIGTTSPTSHLHVAFSSSSGDIGTVPTVRVHNTNLSGFSFASYVLESSQNNMVGQFFADGSGQFRSGTANLFFRTAGSHPILFGTNSTVRMTIEAGGEVRLFNDVSVGADATPGAALDVTGNQIIDGNADEIQLLIQAHSTQTNDLFVIEEAGGTDLFTIGNDPADAIASASGAIWDWFDIKAHTQIISGSTEITTTAGFNLINISQPTLSGSAKFKVSTAATLYIADAPTAAGTLDSTADINEGGTFTSGDTTLTVTDTTQFMFSASGVGPSIVLQNQNIQIDSERLTITAVVAKADSTADTDGITGTGTTILTTDGTQFAATQVVQIDDELMLLTGVSTNTITVTRGLLGTNNETHNTGVDIFHLDDLTVTRAAEGTTAASHSDGTNIFHVTPRIGTGPPASGSLKTFAFRVDAGDVSFDGNLGLGTQSDELTNKLTLLGNLFMSRDNDKIHYGTGTDVSMYWDGTNFQIEMVSAGAFKFGGAINLLTNPLQGGTSSGGSLILESTTNATKGSIFFGAGLISRFDQAQTRLSIGIQSAAGTIHADQSSSTGAIPALFLDQGDVSEQCIQFSSDATDQDINLFTVNVTGAPKLLWDESEDDFNFSKGITVSGDLDGTTIGGITTANLLDKAATETVSGAYTHSSDITMSGANIVMGDNSVTGIDTLTFTDTQGTIAGIQNQNLLDSTVAELIAGAWTFNEAGNDVDYRFEGLNDTTLLVTNAGNDAVGIGKGVPLAKLQVDQTSSTGAKPVLALDQGDIDDTFINYIGTSAADSSRSISSSTAAAAAKFGAFRVEINGVTKWVRVYDSAV
ncbi:MAG: hypothetical protein V3U27_21525 [Candidatus Tectomicrobia bacterium]